LKTKFKLNLIHKSHGGEIFELSESQSSNFLDFSTNINPLITTNMLKLSTISAIEDMTKYPDSNSLKLKKKLVEMFHPDINQSNVIIGAGAMELISVFCDCLISKGDKVGILQPTFSEYEWAVEKNEGIVQNLFRYPENNFSLQPEELMKKLDPQTKILFLCNPNNPNGKLDSKEQIEFLVSLAQNKGILIFLDEAFIEFTEDFNQTLELIHKYPNLFICRSLTKFYGVPGIRIGYGLGSSDLIRAMQGFQNLWSVNCIAQQIMFDLLNNDLLHLMSHELFSSERDYMFKELAKIPHLKMYSTDVNFILIEIETQKYTAQTLQQQLLKENILIRDCSNYKGLDDGYFRICIKQRKENSILINKLKEILNHNA
jgi:threonine-phosphate decarboxylase